jgi:hypothetical protein
MVKFFETARIVINIFFLPGGNRFGSTGEQEISILPPAAE